MPRTLLLLMVLVNFDWALTGRILGLFPAPSISHQLPFMAIMRELAARGHQVTVMTTDPVEVTANMTQIDVSFSYAILRDNFNFVSVSNSGVDGVGVLRPLHAAELACFHQQMASPGMKLLLDDPNVTFDVCFVEIFGRPLVAAKDRFNCSLVLISSMNAWYDHYDAMGSPWNPVAYNAAFSRGIGPKTFWERLHAVYQSLLFYYIIFYELSDCYDTTAKKYFGNNVRSVKEIHADADMLFINVHPVLGEIRPTTPNIVFIGSVHLKAPKPLPKIYQTILDSSKNGAIYLSFGSNVKSIDLNVDKRKAFLDAFKDLPYTVLWKWENDTMPEKPDNVHISKWMPQNDILAHPNVKLFIMQGGQQSFGEAMLNKVPLIVMPFINDQFLTRNKVVGFELGLSLNSNELNKDVVKRTIIEVITNTKYQQNVEKMSDLIKDEPQTSLERAVWWTEYLIRHGDAKHLKAHEIPYYQYLMLDIIGCVFASVIIAFSFIYFLCRITTKKLRSMLNEKQQIKKNK